MVDFRMPSLGADMEAGTLVEWLVNPGDTVKRGDVIAVVETQKGAIEIEVFETGRIGRILVDLNTRVPVGTPLAEIITEAETAAGPPPASEAAVTPAARAPGAPAAEPESGAPVSPAAERESAVPVPPASAHRPEPAVTAPAMAEAPATGRVHASPAARMFARTHAIDLAGITGSGPAGAVLRADVERHVRQAHHPPETRRAIGIDPDAMRAAIAAAMARAKREIPHYYLEHQVDVGACERWLADTNSTRPPGSRLLFGALAVKAVALAARRFPAFNGFFRDGNFIVAQDVHVGVAIAVRGGGLAAPALHDADRMPLDDLMARMRDLVQRMRAGRIRSSELSDPTITVSSLGERGVDALYGIIYPPQVAIVGFGRIAVRPWVVDGAIGPRPVVTITLSADHRVSDGHAGALFLAAIGKRLQEPEKL